MSPTRVKRRRQRIRIYVQGKERRRRKEIDRFKKVTSQTAETDVCGARLGGDLGQSQHKTMRTIKHFFRRTDSTQLWTNKTHALDRRRHSEESKLKKLIKIQKNDQEI